MDSQPIDGPCPNCGTPRAGRFCSNCGQRAVALRPTLHELLHEALHEFVHIDGKLIRTISLVLFRPGQLIGKTIAIVALDLVFVLLTMAAIAYMTLRKYA